MEFLKTLEGLRVPGLNEFMLAITHLGSETAFLVVALIVFWCVSKYQGYYLLGVGLFGTLANQFLKITCRILRPWDLDPDFTILEAARADAGGYSFPSGHSQTAVGTFGGIAATSCNRWVIGLCVAVSVLVPFSRMYVGVHTPADVLVGSGMALVMVFAFKPLMLGKNKHKWIPGVFLGALVLSIGFLVYVENWNFPENLQQHNYEAAVESAYTLMGCLAGILVAYYADEKRFHFEVEACWWAQILKVVFGLVAVLAVKEGLRSPLELLFGGHMIARAVRYFLIVIMAAIIWPLSFRWFARLGRKEN